MSHHNQHPKYQGEADPEAAHPATKWERLLDYLVEITRQADLSLLSDDPHLGVQETQQKQTRALNEIRLLRRIQHAVDLIEVGKPLPSSAAGDFLQADGVEVTDDDLYEDV